MGILSSIFNREKVDYRKLLDEGAKLIDVRTKAEFKSAHAKGSVNKPLDKISSWGKQLNQGDRVVLVCKSGVRASMAKRQLKSMGIEAYNAGSWHSMSE